MGRIKKIHNNVELDRYNVKDTARLLAFNITKKRIADLCNEEFKNDPFEKEVNYSSWHRALDGQEVWIGVVQQIEGLYDGQVAHPSKYLPQDDPGEDLAKWMKKFAGATWWHDVLQPDMSINALNGWFSGRSKTKDELRDKVNAWWARLQSAVAGAERYSAVQERDRNRENNRTVTWDTWCKDQLEDGVSIDDLRKRFVEECLFADFNHLSLIDLKDPQSPVYGSRLGDKHKEYERGQGEQEFDALHKAGFPKAKSRTPPDFDKEVYFEVSQWGDRRNEECPKDINTFLYGKWYRKRCQRYWDAEERKVGVECEIIEVSVDGENWRDANGTEKAGWESGIYFWEKALIEDQDTSNSYSRELEEAKRKEKHLRRLSESAVDPDEQVKFGAKWKDAVRDLDIAYDNTYGQYD